jgi:hypothetical protein
MASFLLLHHQVFVGGRVCKQIGGLMAALAKYEGALYRVLYLGPVRNGPFKTAPGQKRAHIIPCQPSTGRHSQWVDGSEIELVDYVPKGERKHE